MSRSPPSEPVARDSVSDDPRRILAMGGGGFTMRERSPALDRLVLELTGRPVPRICFLPTASGDPREQTTRFHERFGQWPCEPSVLSLFHLGRDRLDPRTHLLAQDAIYVGGGSMRNMLAVWREHGVDEVMRAAWERGIVLAGLSAGAMCWFEGGVTMSGGFPAPAAGLGLLPGSLSVHLDSEPERLPAYLDAVGDGRLPGGWAAEDATALFFPGQELARCVTSRLGGRVTALRPDGEGGAMSDPVAVQVLPGAASGRVGRAGAAAGLDGVGRRDGSDSYGVSELRALRAGRRRWS